MEYYWKQYLNWKDAETQYHLGDWVKFFRCYFGEKKLENYCEPTKEEYECALVINVLPNGSIHWLGLRMVSSKIQAWFKNKYSTKTVTHVLTVCISMIHLQAHSRHGNEAFATAWPQWQLDPQTAVHQLIAGVSPWKIKTVCTDHKVRENRFSTASQSGEIWNTALRNKFSCWCFRIQMYFTYKI